MISQPTAKCAGCTSTQAHEHLWNENDVSPTAARRGKGKRKVSSAAAALKETKRHRVEVIDLTGDEPMKSPACSGSSKNKIPSINSSSERPCRPEPAPLPQGSVRSAWLNAAMAWRQKNMPSPSELRRRKADAAARTARESQVRKMRAKESRYRVGAAAAAAAEQERQRMRFERQHQEHQHAFPADPSIVRPTESAPLEEWQAYYRAFHGSRIQGAASFVQVLRAFDIPCDDPKKIKVSYMQAVRMYHPDSNSKTRSFTNERDRLEAEEIMKLINQRKPDQF